MDDDMAERTYWADILRAHGCMVQIAKNGGDAVKLAAKEAFDCVLLIFQRWISCFWEEAPTGNREDTGTVPGLCRR